MKPRTEIPASTSPDWDEDLACYRCSSCREQCINPADSQAAKRHRCRDCLDLDAPPAPAGDGPDWSRRVDPDEPYRYACPECGSVYVVRRPYVAERYCCGQCDWTGSRDDVVDLANTTNGGEA